MRSTVASAAQLMHVVWLDEFSWSVLRFITGACLCGLYMVMESWINERSSQEHRGRILSVYQIVNLGAVTAGQLMLNLYDPAGFQLFVIGSVLVSISLVPVALTRTVAPQPLQKVRIRISRVFGISPVGVISCLTVGLVNGAIWTIVPLYAQNTLNSIAELSLFMSLIIIGGAAFQWPLGRWSDIIDRRWVIIFICVVPIALPCYEPAEVVEVAIEEIRNMKCCSRSTNSIVFQDLECVLNQHRVDA